MYRIKTVVKNLTGLHSRPAQRLVQLSNMFKSEIRLITAEKNINAKSIFNVLGGALKQGTPITVQAEGEDEREAAETIVSYIEGLTE